MSTDKRGFFNEVENTNQPGVAFNDAVNIIDRLYGALAINFTLDATLELTQTQADYQALVFNDTGPVLTGPQDVVFTDSFPMKLVVNNTAQVLTLKKDGETGVALAAGEQTLIGCGLTDVVEIAGGGGAVSSVNGATGAALVLVPFAIAFSDETTAITAGTNKARWINPSDKVFNVVHVAASLNVAQTSGSIFTLDINEAGSSILSTKLTIDNGETVGGSHATAGSTTPAVISDAAIAGFAQVSVDVDQVGDGTAIGGKVYLIGYWTP